MSSGGGGRPPGDADGYGQGGGYGGDEVDADRDQGRYFDESGYEWSEPSGRSRSQGDSRADQYGQNLGRHSGRHSAGPSYGDSYGQDGYGQDGYRQDPYGDSYGQGWQLGSRHADDQRGRHGYDQGGYGQGSYGQAGFGSYDEPGYGRDGYGRDLGPDRYARGSYSQDGYGQDGYGQDGYGGAYYGQPSADSYGRDQYGQEGYGSTASYQAPGGYQAPDGYGQDNGYGPQGRPVRPALEPGPDQDVTSSYRPDSGSFDGRDIRDSGWFSQPSDTGSFGRPDTGSFGRPDAGSFGAADGYLSDGQPDPFGPPAASLRRTELGGSAAGRIGDDNSPFGVSQNAARAGGYDQWHDAGDDADGWDSDEAAEPDVGWQDDAESGLLSRRFGSDGGGGRGSRRGSGRRAGRPKRPRRLRGKFATIAAILAGALVLGAVADYGYERFNAWHTGRYGDYQGAGSGQVKFTVPPGAVLSSLGLALMKAGVIMEVRPFDSAAAAATNASHLQPGVYLLHRHMQSAVAVQYLLSSGHRVNDQVTIIEGTRASAIAQQLAKQTGIPVGKFTEIIDHPPASLGLPSWSRAKTAEGFLFPDTYTLLPKMTALQILQMMVTEFKQKVAAINLVGSAQKVFTTPWHALIVASLIQAEAGRPSDFPKISRVVWDRLLQGMNLQFDSTIFYAMHTYGTYAKTPAERNFPSPYNTYLHAGLPPGPIGNPGLAAIQAAVHASHGLRYLYFITDTRHKPYITYFTPSFQQFQQWQQQFQG